MFKRSLSLSSLLLVAALLGTSVSPVYAATKMNVNQAGAKSLVALKGIGPKTAQAIVHYRQKHGDYTSAKQLAAVRGLTIKRITKIQHDNGVDFIVK